MKHYDQSSEAAWETIIADKNQRIAELVVAAKTREAQLAEMVKKIQAGINWMTETVSCEWLAECFREHDIPTTPPEAKNDE